MPQVTHHLHCVTHASKVLILGRGRQLALLEQKQLSAFRDGGGAVDGKEKELNVDERQALAATLADIATATATHTIPASSSDSRLAQATATAGDRYSDVEAKGLRKEGAVTLVAEEERKKGMVSRETYGKYFTAGGRCLTATVVVLFILGQVSVHCLS